MVKYFGPTRLCLPACLLGLSLFSFGSRNVTRADEPAQFDGDRFFREKIEPVLKKECFGCHSAEAKEVKGGLRLDTRSELRRGGDSGAVVVAGMADKSRLVQAIRHEADLVMPPEKPKLPAET